MCPKWLTQLFRAIDGMDVEEFLGFLTEDVVFRFGSAPAAHGKPAVRQAITHFFAGIDGLSHSILHVWQEGDTLVCEGEVAYRLPGGAEATLPFVNVFRTEGDLVRDYRIYADRPPLAAGSH